MHYIGLRRMRLLSLCATVLLGLGFVPSLVAPPATQAQERERCFAETGYCVRGALLDYWEQHGGLTVFGYPISDLRLETIEGEWTGPVQWFERDRLEDHGIAGVLAGRLGAYHLERQGYDMWNPANRADGEQPGCRYFPETGQNLCEPFLSYWQANDGLTRFGYPLTGAFPERVGDWEGTVQYFERRRMEYHPELPDTRAQILLGNLGSGVLGRYPDAAQVCASGVLDELRDDFNRVRFREALGCPGEAYWNVPATVQPFERGGMLWLDLGEMGGKIVATSTLPLIFQRMYEDTWTPDQPTSAGWEAPQGRSEPQHGFGNVWRTDEALRDRLGWATAPARAETATVQRFDHGWLLILHGSNTFYAFGPQSDHLVSYSRPELVAAADGSPGLLAGVPAPPLGGELVVRTQSVDFYRSPGGLTTAEVGALSGAVEAAIASGTTMMGNNLAGRVSIRFEPAQTGICAIRGLTLSNQRTIRMFYNPGSNLYNIESILAHEFIHQLQHDYYGVPYHLRSDTILLEGMAEWASSPYNLEADGQPYYHAEVQQAFEKGALLPLTTSLEADCRTTTRNTLYEQWASFAEYLLVTYGRDSFDAVYRSNTGRPAGAASYEAVYGKSLAALEAEWQAWLAAGRQ